MIPAGASAKAVQTVLGHGSAAFTLTGYGHLFDEDLDERAGVQATVTGHRRCKTDVLVAKDEARVHVPAAER